MHVTTRAVGVVITFALTATTVTAQTFNGTNFAVETYTTGAQGAADAAINRAGHFIVTWAGYVGHDSDYLGVAARLYNSSGLPVGAEFGVNTLTTEDQSLPAIAVAPNGRFVVVWQSYGADGDMYGVRGRLFNSDGSPIGGEFQVNTYTSGYQYLPDVAFNPDGTFVVVWQTDDQDGNAYGIAARRFDNNANPLGMDFVVNSYTLGYQYGPRIATNPTGFAVAWEGEGFDDPDGVFFHAFLPNGVPVGVDFRVNSVTTNFQRYPSVAAGGSSFVVAWEEVTPALERDVWARRYNLPNFLPGVAARVNTFTTDQQRRPNVAVDNTGQFVVSWHSGTYSGAYLYDIRGRMFNNVGVAQGTEFTVNSYTTGQHQYPSVAAGRNGNFLVVWEGDHTGSFGVYGQRLGDLIFSDNFETF
jgi:hypothetical protein